MRLCPDRRVAYSKRQQIRRHALSSVLILAWQFDPGRCSLLGRIGFSRGPEMKASFIAAERPQPPEPKRLSFVYAVILDPVGMEVLLGEQAPAGFEIVLPGKRKLPDNVPAFSGDSPLTKNETELHLLLLAGPLLNPETGPWSGGESWVGFEFGLVGLFHVCAPAPGSRIG